MEDKTEERIEGRPPLGATTASTINGNFSHDSKHAEKKDENLVEFSHHFMPQSPYVDKYTGVRSKCSLNGARSIGPKPKPNTYRLCCCAYYRWIYDLEIHVGFFCSAAIANIGGMIVGMWDHHHTGFPLFIFTLTSASGSSSGVFAYSFIAQLHGLKAVEWGMTGVTAGFFVLLSAKSRKETGNQDLEVAEDMRTQSLKHLINISLARPFHFMFIEPVIMFCAAYNRYLFGLTFLFNGAFALVFGPEGYGFNTIEQGLANLGVVVGVCFGPLTHLWQERYYLRKVEETGGKNVPEARVQMSMVAAIVFPASLFWFAWTTYTSVHWIVPIIASAFYGWSFYTLILMTFMYVEDTYKCARWCMLRLKHVRRCLPLFGSQMFENLGYRWAGSVLGFLALLLIPIPFVLARWGRTLREKSPWAREHIDDPEDNEIDAIVRLP
ncbi:hypothetical protein BDZ45DRAFT_746646 [Acephala macrosclerotiorum]|nr:hypothetical protein BDZ45DRAFT_746646 [Acephala macrosclerotiorum]